MKAGYTHIEMLLDRSGSMWDIRDDVLGGINTFIEQQKEQDGEASMTLILFDDVDRYEVVFKMTPLPYVKALTPCDFVPRGGTPFLDALGRTISELEKTINGMAEDMRPEKVIVAVVTDGRENMSYEFTKAQVVKLIEDKKSVWEFVFLSADMDAICDARGIGIRADCSSGFDKSAAGVAAGFSKMSGATRAYRSGETKAFQFKD